LFWYQFNKKGGVCRVEDRTKYIARTERQEPDKTANRKKDHRIDQREDCNEKESQKQDTIDRTQNRRTEIEPKTTQNEEKKDRNGQNIQGVIDRKDRSRT